MLKRKQIGPLNQKRRNFFITASNCRTACKEWSIRDPLRSHNNKTYFIMIKLILLWFIADIGAVKNTIIIKTKILYIGNRKTSKQHPIN